MDGAAGVGSLVQGADRVGAATGLDGVEQQRVAV
jgi:hypothetical protein